MPVDINSLRTSLAKIGGKKMLAAQHPPYVTDTILGFVHTDRTSGSALLAALVIYHEADDLAVEVLKEEELSTLRKKVEAAVKDLRDGRLNNTSDVQGIQAGVTGAKRELNEGLYRELIQMNLESGAASAAYLDIVGCHQVRPLSHSNIFNYFKMMEIPSEDIPEDLHQYSAYWARYNPGIADSAGFQLRITLIEWVYYHVNASQNGPLVMRALMICPVADDGSSFFSTAEIDAARLHFNDTKSMILARNVPKSALVKAYALYEAMDSLPEKKWYMGHKAMQAYPVCKYKIIIKAIKRHIVAVERETLPDEEEDPKVIASKINSLVSGMVSEERAHVQAEDTLARRNTAERRGELAPRNDNEGGNEGQGGDENNEEGDGYDDAELSDRSDSRSDGGDYIASEKSDNDDDDGDGDDIGARTDTGTTTTGHQANILEAEKDKEGDVEESQPGKVSEEREPERGEELAATQLASNISGAVQGMPTAAAKRTEDKNDDVKVDDENVGENKIDELGPVKKKMKVTEQDEGGEKEEGMVNEEGTEAEQGQMEESDADAKKGTDKGNKLKDTKKKRDRTAVRPKRPRKSTMTSELI